MNIRRMDKSESVPTSSRLLPDIPCKVCSDHSSGKHYGIYACDGCAGFFKRSIRRGRSYECKTRSPASGACAVDKTHRNQCRSCRLRKCLQVGMNKEAVQHERGPRHSTMRRQMAACLKDSPTISAAAGPVASSHIVPPAFRPHLLSASGNTGLTGFIPSFADVMHLSAVRITLGPRAFVHQPVPKYPGEISLPFSDSPEVTQELAARVLFRAIKWVKGVQTLGGLPMPDQLLLLNERWIHVFVLTAAEAQMTIQPKQLLRAAGIVVDTSCSLNDRQMSPVVAEIHLLQDILLKFQSLQIDATEFACLRGISFFEADLKSSSSSSSTSSEGRVPHPFSRGTLTDRAPVDALRDQAQLLLTKYIETTFPSQPLRFGRLLLLLPSLASISAATIEDIFFRSTIGDTPIERLIANMYQTEASNAPY